MSKQTDKTLVLNVTDLRRMKIAEVHKAAEDLAAAGGGDLKIGGAIFTVQPKTPDVDRTAAVEKVGSLIGDEIDRAMNIVYEKRAAELSESLQKQFEKSTRALNRSMEKRIHDVSGLLCDLISSTADALSVAVKATADELGSARLTEIRATEDRIRGAIIEAATNLSAGVASAKAALVTAEEKPATTAPEIVDFNFDDIVVSENHADPSEADVKVAGEIEMINFDDTPAALTEFAEETPDVSDVAEEGREIVDETDTQVSEERVITLTADEPEADDARQDFPLDDDADEVSQDLPADEPADFPG